ncbi:hypothetical protein [Streptomyces olivaceoviridis]|uniref:hypothetical protein n=1 Tax=Streptomyces olivaceoviridis TaxID=1921 RepID=UPI003792DBEF
MPGADRAYPPARSDARHRPAPRLRAGRCQLTDRWPGLLDALVRCGGPDFDLGSPWDLGLGLVALATVRTGLVRWLAVLTGRNR